MIRFKIFIVGFGILAMILTLLPLFAADYWWIRIFDFPHTQLTVITFIAIVAYLFHFEFKHHRGYLFIALLLCCFTFQLMKIYPYTPLATFEVHNTTTTDPQRSLKVYTANVLQENKDKSIFLDQIKLKNADLVLVCEADAKWMDFLNPQLRGNYPYSVKAPLNNTYGMLLYSKLKLIGPKVRFLVDDSIPSIHSRFLLRSGDTIQLYAIHPTPPMPQHNPSSSDRDTEMMLVARLSRTNKYPIIVMGDFNDVAWSGTTKLFKATGELLDVRVGRGLYNTFNADSKLLRWPLDHIFSSSEFRLNSLSVGPDIHSDHFPSYVNLSFEPEKAEEQQPKPPTTAQLKSAENQINSSNIDFVQ